MEAGEKEGRKTNPEWRAESNFLCFSFLFFCLWNLRKNRCVKLKRDNRYNCSNYHYIYMCVCVCVCVHLESMYSWPVWSFSNLFTYANIHNTIYITQILYWIGLLLISVFKGRCIFCSHLSYNKEKKNMLTMIPFTKAIIGENIQGGEFFHKSNF